MIHRIIDDENLRQAYQAIGRNLGPKRHSDKEWQKFHVNVDDEMITIRDKLARSQYWPQPARQQVINKPGGGIRALHIPTIRDRVIQRAIHQTIEPIFEPTFHPHSYGYRRGRGVHQAIYTAQGFIAAGHHFATSIDIADCFGSINQDALMVKLSTKIGDKQVLQLIGRYLRAGIMNEGTLYPTENGVPQGGPLSPTLANIYLHQFDEEMQARGHRFIRFADDIRVFTRSERAARRVLQTASDYLGTQLRLHTNNHKSGTTHYTETELFGFNIRENGRIAIQNSRKTDLAAKIVEMIDTEEDDAETEQVLLGWLAHYHIADSDCLKEVDTIVEETLAHRPTTYQKWHRQRERLSRPTLAESGLEVAE